VLPNGNALVPELGNNRVVEYDPDGKTVREFTVEQPIAAVRLPNGHTLVTSMTQHRAIELDRTGKEVWEFKHATRVTRALRR
jgi:outer membrane protein assembly factor BamB